MNLALFFRDFTFIWNLKNKISKCRGSRLTDTENKFKVVRGERGLGKRGDKAKKYKYCDDYIWCQVDAGLLPSGFLAGWFHLSW